MGLGSSRTVYLYAIKPDAQWVRPADTVDAHLEHGSFVAATHIFFIDSPNKCVNCISKEPHDMLVDVTAALREKGLSAPAVVLKAEVYNVATGKFEPIEATPLEAPVLRGPSPGTETEKGMLKHTYHEHSPSESTSSPRKPGRIEWYIEEDSVPYSLRDRDGNLGLMQEFKNAFSQWSSATGI